MTSRSKVQHDNHYDMKPAHRPYAGQQNTVDATELDVDLETQVGDGLWRCFVDVL